MYGLGMTNTTYQRIDAIVGYVYRADIVCPECVLGEMRSAGLPVSQHLEDTVPTEAAVDSVAADIGVDPMDEASFDSDYFPKVIFLVDVEDDETCGVCGEPVA